MTEWETKTLGEVAQIERGKFSHRPRNEPRFYGGNTPFVQTGDVTRSNGIVRNHTQSLNDDGVAISKVFPAGTILITIAANIGYAGILEFDSAAPDSLIGLTPNDTVSPEFLNFYLRTQQPEMDRMAPKGTQKNINIEFLKPWPVVVPPLPEQKKIAHILSTVQRAIEAQERIIQTTTELKKALMHKLFTEGLRGEPQKQTEIGPVPESWQVVKIKDHCIDSAFGPRFGSELYAADGNILTLRTTDMEDDGRIDYNTAPLARIDYAKFEKHYLQVGDVVVSRSGTCGIASVFKGHRLPVLPGAFLIRLRMKDSVQPMFLRHYINSPVGRPYVLQLAQGAIQKNISGTRLGDLLIPLPSRAEQEEISSAVGTIDQKLANHRQKLSANQDLFRTLLHALMTAKSRVHRFEFS